MREAACFVRNLPSSATDRKHRALYRGVLVEPVLSADPGFVLLLGVVSGALFSRRAGAEEFPDFLGGLKVAAGFADESLGQTAG